VRDIVWTIILIWLVWKIYDTFKSVTKPKNQTAKQNHYHQTRDGEVRIDNNVKQKPYFNPNDGEFVDYEEIK
jgi:hypothetical protein